MTIDPPESPPERPLDELDVLEEISAKAFIAHREHREGDGITARRRYDRLRALVARLPR